MATLALTKETIDETIKNNDIVIIDFWAEWCGPCKAFGPVFEKVSETHEDIVFAKCNTEEQQELASNFQIQSIPTIMVFREQIQVFRQSGALPEEALEELIGKIKGLDMDDVRRQNEEAEKSDGGCGCGCN